MKYTTSAKNVEKCNLYQLGQVSFSFSGLFFAQGNPRETRYFLLILPKCKMVHYMKLTNICLTLLVNSFFSLCILPNSSEYALWCIFAKLLTFCITVHFCNIANNLIYGAFLQNCWLFALRCIFVDNFSAQLSPQVTSGGCWLPSFALLHTPPVSGFCATSGS